ncbi:Diaminopimelate epimerase-like protein [Pyrenochaeta sp. DS3sAY3a]|nr:Diaminopimelate epimerase-like protein [Pyrenochaeta sp. DS3sAY3a]
MKLSFATLDVFTTTRYTGNPLAVVLVPASLSSSLSESQKQKIAREFNYSETTFLHEPSAGSDTADFDIFTPLARMSFAGHPTIGTAIYAAQHAESYKGVTALRTLAGRIPFVFNPDTHRATVHIPHDVHIHTARLANPLALDQGNALTVPIVSIVKGMAFGLAKLPDLETLGRATGPLVPAHERYESKFLDEGSGWDVGYTGTFWYVDLGFESDDASAPGSALEGEGKGEVKGKEEKVRLLRTRSTPAHEDPGTGSASAALCAYLALQEGASGEKKTSRFHLVQGVEMGRRCDIFVEVGVDGEGVIEGVRLSGSAVGVMGGVLEIFQEKHAVELSKYLYIHFHEHNTSKNLNPPHQDVQTHSHNTRSPHHLQNPTHQLPKQQLATVPNHFLNVRRPWLVGHGRSART